MEENTSTLESKVMSVSPSGQTEEQEWLIPKQQQVNSDDINTVSDITESLFSTGRTPSTVASKAPLIVDLNENPADDGDTLDAAQGSTLSELMIPLEITPSFSSNAAGRRPLIEEIDDSISSNTGLLVHSSSNKEEGSTNPESSISKAASFHSTASKEPESTPTEFGGQWAQRTRPLIEEVTDVNTAKTDTVKVETIEDLEDFETPQLHPVGDQFSNIKASQPAGEDGKKETLCDTKSSSEGEVDRITELAEKAGSTLDPVTVDQALLQSLRQKYQ